MGAVVLANYEETAMEAAAKAAVSLSRQIWRSHIKPSEARAFAFGIVLAWTQGRAYGASIDRKGRAWVTDDAQGYEPDGYTLGYAESILPALGGVSGLPWDKALQDWSKDEILRLVASSAEMVEDARTNVLESNSEDIPF